MSPRHPVSLPQVWLMTDERMEEKLWAALEHLPRGAGVVFRHYDATDRLALWRRVRRIARRRGLILLAAGKSMPGCDGVHNGPSSGGLRTQSVHNAAEARGAIRARANAAFVSPVFPTRSHPGQATLGVRGLIQLGKRLPMPVIALGGMNERRFRPIAPLAYGWAGIDAWV